MEIEKAVFDTVNNLVDKVVFLSNIKNQRAESEDSVRSLCLIIADTSSAECSTNNSPLPQQTNEARFVLLQENIFTKNLELEKQESRNNVKNNTKTELIATTNEHQQFNEKIAKTAILQSVKKPTLPSSSNSTIKLMSIRPSPLLKLLPKSQKPKVVNKNITKISGAANQSSQTMQKAKQKVQIVSPLTNQLDGKSTINVPIITANTITQMVPNADPSDKVQSVLKDNATHLNRPPELSIKPKMSQQPVVLTTFTTTTTTPLEQLSKTTSPTISTITPITTSVTAPTPISSADLFAMTVDKIASGAEVSPSQEEKTATIKTSQPKTKLKKKIASKANGNGEHNAKEKIFLNSASSQNTNILPIISTNNFLSDSSANGNTLLPTSGSGMIFPSNQPFTLASNANFGGAYYIIRQQPNATNQLIPIAPQLFLSSMQQIDLNKNSATTTIANQQVNQPESQKQQQPAANLATHFMGNNVLYRSAGNTLFMPTMISASTAAKNVIGQQIPMQGSMSNSQSPRFIQPKSTPPTILPKSAHPSNKSSVMSMETNTKISLAQQHHQIATTITNSNQQIFPSGQQGRIVQIATSSPSNSITIREQLQQQANNVNQNHGNGIGLKCMNEVKNNTPSKSRRKKKQEKIKESPLSQLKQMPTLEANGKIVDEEENEPPPILCRDEPSGTQSLESLFQKEAKIIREKMFDGNGKKNGPLKHYIDGFEIEEDIEPFPCEHQKILNQLRDKSPEKNGFITTYEKAQFSASEMKGEKSSINNSPGKEKWHKRIRVYSSSSENSSQSRSPIKKKFNDVQSSKRPTKKGRQRELEGLLKMDFGPGKTPFPTSDPDEYAEEVFIEVSKQQRTLALAAEERNARQSSERPSSSTKIPKRDKEKSGNIQASNEVKQKQDKKILNEKADAKNVDSVNNLTKSPKNNDNSEDVKERHFHELEFDEGSCSFCKKPFKEVGRDKEHNQYCSKECRKRKKQFKKLKSKSMDSNMNTSDERNTPNRRSDPTTPRKSAEIITSPPKMTSPLGSAFSAVQPQMITNGGRTPIISGALKRKWTVDEQATQLAAAQQQQNQAVGGQFTGSIQGGFEFGTPPPCGDQMFLNNSQQQVPIPSQQQMIVPIPFQNQYRPPHMHPYTFSQETNTHFMHPTSQQQMMVPAPTNFYPNSYPVIASQQQAHTSGIISPHVPSPANLISPLEKNTEIEMLMTRSTESWTGAEVAKWVNFITNSNSIGERFIQEEVTGSSLLHLTFDHLQNQLKLKLGPAVKLNSALNALRAKPLNR